jgi:hypothetical protein
MKLVVFEAKIRHIPDVSRARERQLEHECVFQVCGTPTRGVSIPNSTNKLVT